MNQFSGGEKENTWLSSERDGESSVTNSNCSGVRILVKYVGNVCEGLKMPLIDTLLLPWVYTKPGLGHGPP